MSSPDDAAPKPGPPIVAIIGAGIAGLCAALAFAKFGAKVVIFEKADELAEIGASLQLSPNATRILSLLGVLPELQQAWIEPQSICMTDGVSLQALKTLPIAKISKDVWKAPYALISRTDLQRVLLEKVYEAPSCEVRLSSALDFGSTSSLQSDIELRLKRRPTLIVGADGIWSPTRTVLGGGSGVDYTGYVAWRLVADQYARKNMPANINNNRNIMLMMNGDGHIVLYPSDQRGLSNIVFVTEHDADHGDKPDFVETLNTSQLHQSTIKMLKSAHNLGAWTINHVAEGTWTDNNNIALIGDAAHAMSPFMAQGAAMAIEDAYVLASLACATGQDVPSSLQTYETQRKTRVDKVRTRATLNRISYHAKGPIRAGRNLVLSLKSPESLCRDLDWLYGWKANHDQ